MRDWWKKAIFYGLYIRSFCDSNEDGIGDFPGITSKLDYLKELGIDAIWLTPYYVSPNVDFGYDIADYYRVDPSYGTIKDFEIFLAEAHKRGIRVIADLVMNHTSSEHPWFIESKSSRTNPKRDWYIWKDPVNGGPPNNWETGFVGSSWTYDEETEQYYYHAFAKEQPDLNWHNQAVKNELFDVVRYWLEKGLDGFRLDVINHLVVDKEFRDNPFIDGKQLHVYDKDIPQTHEIVKDLRNLVDQYDNKVLVGEVASEDIEIAKTYVGNAKELDLVFNFNLGSIPSFDLDRIFNELQVMEEKLDSIALPTLFFSSHDMSRHMTRLCQNKTNQAKLIAALFLTAKGVPFIYYGDEIGMQDIYIEEPHRLKDVGGLLSYQNALLEGYNEKEAIVLANQKGRDKGRSPMQWDNSVFAGFSKSEPWLPVHENFQVLNVQQQKTELNSMLSFYKTMIQLRKKHTSLSLGDYVCLRKEGKVIFYIRNYGDENILVCLNFGMDTQSVKITELQQSAKLVFSNMRDMIAKFEIYNHEVILMPEEILILSFNEGVDL